MVVKKVKKKKILIGVQQKSIKTMYIKLMHTAKMIDIVILKINFNPENLKKEKEKKH